MRFGIRIGPFWASQRVGRTQAQKRAAARQRTERASQREHARRMSSPEVQAEIAAAHARIDRTYTGPVTMSDDGRTLTVTDSLHGELTIAAPDDRFALLHDGDVVRLTPERGRHCPRSLRAPVVRGRAGRRPEIPPELAAQPGARPAVRTATCLMPRLLELS